MIWDRSIAKGKNGIIVTKETPFYAEMGGQAGDIGEIYTAKANAKVTYTKKTGDGIYLHEVTVTDGEFSLNDKVTLVVDHRNRTAIARNHSATHLLHKALKNVLGTHVAQAGSLVTADRLRFDFSHFEAMTPEEKETYDTAYNALIQDEVAMKAYNMVLNLSLLITTVGILGACLLLEFAMPLLLGNGQTVGKKAFGLGVIRIDGVRATPVQMFVRTVLGKFTIETMIPVYVVLMIFFNVTGLGGTLLLGGLLVAQILIMAFNANNALIHDLLAGTVVVDVASQMIFRDTQDLIDYKKKLSREQADRQSY